MNRQPLTYVSPGDPPLKQTVMNALEIATGRKLLAERYRQLQSMDLASHEVWGKALELLEIGVEAKGFPLENIPQEGPLILLANHPFGVVDGLIMGKIAAESRDRFSILVNAVLRGQDPRIEANLLPIDFAETREASLLNIATRKAALEKLSQGEAVVIFPSGGVATAPRVFGQAEELDWKRFTAQMIRKSGATVVPIFFHGQNTMLFHLASKVGPTFRLGLLLREVRKQMGKTVKLTVGEPLQAGNLKVGGQQEMMDLLRQMTMALGSG